MSNLPKKIVLSVSLVALFWGSPQASDTDETINFLMNNHVTYFEWGYYRANELIEKISLAVPPLKKYKKDFIITTKDVLVPEDGKIYIFLGTDQLNDLPTKRSRAKKVCKNILEEVRNFLCVYNGSVAERLGGVSAIGQRFSPGVTNTSTPKNIGKNIDQITKIQSNVYYKGLSGKEECITCKGALLGTEVFCN